MHQPGGGAFGGHFTPHMVISQWSPGHGWQPLAVTPHSPLPLAPSAMALHYGQAIFEGLKAFSRPGGTASIFRPGRHAARFNRSATRLMMPGLPEDLFVQACEQLVRSDRAAVPSGPGQSLYLRPFMIATEASMEVRAAREYLFGVIAAPASALYTPGMPGIAVWCERDYIRAAAGGTGAAKCAGNYAGSMIGKALAARQDCQDVLWLDAAQRRWVEELSGMNFFCVTRAADGALALTTPPLTGTILNGSTRDSILRLAARRGIRTVEAPVEFTELIRPDSPVIEAFGCGTAVTVLPITAIASEAGWHHVGDGQPGRLTLELREDLIAIQEGRLPDEFGWMHPVSPSPVQEKELAG